MNRIIIFASLLGICLSFGCTQHMVVWQIAMLELSEERFNAVTNCYKKMDWTFADDYEIACWADDVRWKYPERSVWHYIDIPFYDGIPPQPWTPPTWNVVSGLEYSIEELKNGCIDGLNAAYVIHLLGDIHCPVHCESRYNDQFPNGDKGGNDFKIKYGTYDKSVHQLWDHAMEKIAYQKRPVGHTSQMYIKGIAEQVMKTYPRSKVNPDVTTWRSVADAAHEVCVNYCYKDLEEYKIPSDTYIDEGWSADEKQIALAGYRLTDILNQLF